MGNLNLVELLRDCPTGMELDSTVFDNITFDYVNTQQNRVYCKVGKSESVWFTPKGGVNLLSDAKCVIFPKGKTTWEGFHRPFEDGDILAIGDTVYIYNGIEELSPFPTHYVYVIADKNGLFAINTSTKKYGTRFATEEEKNTLFDAIKANGYKWNPETKTLEKLPKFKVGDRVKHISADTSGIVVKITDKGYHIDYPKGEGVCYVNFTLEKDYELVPNKFDITTLKAFESRVLVRDYDNQIWIPTFWGKYLEDDSNCRYLTTNGCYKYCIPYEGNQYLLGTTNDCDDFYKTWEK